MIMRSASITSRVHSILSPASVAFQAAAVAMLMGAGTCSSSSSGQATGLGGRTVRCGVGGPTVGGPEGAPASGLAHASSRHPLPAAPSRGAQQQKHKRGAPQADESSHGSADLPGSGQTASRTPGPRWRAAAPGRPGSPRRGGGRSASCVRQAGNKECPREAGNSVVCLSKTVCSQPTLSSLSGPPQAHCRQPAAVSGSAAP